eukprot:10587473-Ditylum_brightwellii.AAC.1
MMQPILQVEDEDDDFTLAEPPSPTIPTPRTNSAIEEISNFDPTTQPTNTPIGSNGRGAVEREEEQTQAPKEVQTPPAPA